MPVIRISIHVGYSYHFLISRAFGSILTLVLLLSSQCVNSRCIIPFWHSLSGKPAEVLTELTQTFNRTQNKCKIKLFYKGEYQEALTGFVAAYRSNQYPAIMQVFEVGTATLLKPKGIIRPVYQLFNQYPQLGHHQSTFLSGLQDYYSDVKHRLLSLPFNSSSIVLYYNQDMLKRAGFEHPPRTWPEMRLMSQRLVSEKITSCGFTTTYPSWIHVENMLLWHGEQILSGNDSQVSFHQPILIYHLNQLVKWHKEKMYEYGGRGDHASTLFTSGHCATMLQSSGGYKNISYISSFPVGVSSLPYWPQFRTNETYVASIGGGSLMVLNGYPESMYPVIAEYFSFLMSPSNQAYWQASTGYFSVVKQLNTSTSNPAAEVASNQVQGKTVTGARLGYFPQIRLYNDQQIEAILSGQLSIEQAMKKAEKYAQKMQRRYYGTQ